MIRRYAAASMFCLCVGIGWGRAADIKISTWNLDWLTARSRGETDLPADVHLRSPEDFIRLAAYAQKLAASIIAFQEVDGPEAAALVFDPAIYSIATIDEPIVQRVGIAVRKPLTLRKNPDLTALDVEAGEKYRLRDGLDVSVTLPAGQTLRILVVHLKTGCQTDDLTHTQRPQCALLARQIPPLLAWISARQAQGIPFLLLGDFNRVFDTPDAFGRALADTAPLLRATEGFENPCWDGAPFIDHIFLGGPARHWLEPDSLRVQLFGEFGEGWKQRLSDHCPVSVTINPGR
jgi:endonuclease/exonuclease/phosphatase family metal-dependent hydrolase